MLLVCFHDSLGIEPEGRVRKDHHSHPCCRSPGPGQRTKVLMIDADPQGTALDWSVLQEGGTRLPGHRATQARTAPRDVDPRRRL